MAAGTAGPVQDADPVTPRAGGACADHQLARAVAMQNGDLAAVQPEAIAIRARGGGYVVQVETRARLQLREGQRQ